MRRFNLMMLCTTFWVNHFAALIGAAADWPQACRDAQHTGNAADERLDMPLGLLAQVKLDDAILTSPVVVAGKLFAVDQMGTAYCVDPDQGRIIWKSSPEGTAALGSNTSSPCVGNGGVFYGTIAGNLHILDSATGKTMKSISFGQPILDSITLANGSVYFQTLDAVVHCVDLEGNRRWHWDPYGVDDGAEGLGSQRQYGGVAVSVLGRRLVASVGFGLVCLEDRGAQAQVVWSQPQPLGRSHVPVATSISGDFVYAAFPGKDGRGSVLRVSLEDGSFEKQQDLLDNQWATLAAPAVRDHTAYYSRQAFGVTAHRFGASDGSQPLWCTFGADAEQFTPSLSSPALSQQYCIFPTLYGEIIAVHLDAEGRGLDALVPTVHRFKTPHGKPISGSPAIAGGRVYFGCDDGYLYVLGTGKSIAPITDQRGLHQRRSQTTVAGLRRYGWPSAFGGPRNANFVEDPALKPPFQVRWAARSGGLFKQPVCATEEDVIYVTLGGLVVCREQQTARIRWRRKLPKQVWCRSALLCADGKVFVPRMFSLRYPMVHGQANAMYCLDEQTGEILWESPIGIGDRLRASPVFADGVVAYGSLYHRDHPPVAGGRQRTLGQAVDAWDAITGRHLWRVKFNSSGMYLNGPAGCAGDSVMFFSGGGESPGATGETMAIDPRSGKILWRTADAFTSQTGTPSFQDGKVYLPGTYKLPLACLSASDGRLLWQQDEGRHHWHVDTISLGPDYFTVNNKYKGGALRWNLADGTLDGTSNQRIQLWGPDHGCGSVVLTSEGMALSATIGGLYMTDTRTGEILWKSPGFASYTCPHAIASNGRIFYCPQTSGVMFCFEPEGAAL